MKNQFICLFILIFKLSTSVQAQPTIDYSWYLPFSTFALDYSANEYTIGNAGMNQTWDFSASLSFPFSNYIDVNYTQGGFAGGNADYKFHFYTSPTWPSNYYDFYEAKNSDSLIFISQNSWSWPGGGTIFTSSLTYLNPILILKFPFSYQTSAIDSFVKSSTSSSSGSMPSSSSSFGKGKREILVDGFGDLVLPDGLHSNSFRVKYIDTFIDSSWIPIANLSIITSRVENSYSYWTTDNGILQKRYIIEWDSLINGGTPPGNNRLRARYYSSISLVDLEENNYKSKNVIVYPNPVQEYCTIKTPSILIKKAKLEIYNSISGLALESSIIPTEVDQIKFETNGLAPGYYKAVIRQDDKVWTAGFIKQ